LLQGLPERRDVRLAFWMLLPDIHKYDNNFDEISAAKGHVRFTPNSDRKSGFPHSQGEDVTAQPSKLMKSRRLIASPEAQDKAVLGVHVLKIVG
jgi:hypothetical protein